MILDEYDPDFAKTAGREEVQTPHMDSLVKKGVRLAHPIRFHRHPSGLIRCGHSIHSLCAFRLADAMKRNQIN